MYKNDLGVNRSVPDSAEYDKWSPFLKVKLNSLKTMLNINSKKLTIIHNTSCLLLFINNRKQEVNKNTGFIIEKNSTFETDGLKA